MTDWQGFYSTAQVARLARIPTRTLYAWKARGIIAPSVQIIGAGGVGEEGYSYADLAIIKLMRGLRKKKLNLRSVAQTLRHLYDRFGPPTSSAWQGAHGYIEGKEAYAQKPDEWDTTVGTRGGQRLMVGFDSMFEEEASLLVPKGFAEYVEINLNVMDGLPVIRGTRVPTSSVSMMADQDVSLSELADLYSPISRVYLRKAIEFERSLDRTSEEALDLA